MKHNTLVDLDTTVGLHAVGKASMSRQERLERWAELLSREPQRVLSALEGTEYQTGETQARMRCDHSPISVAYADAILRAEGLENDTYGAARKFFGLSDEQLHEIVCYCYHGFTMYSGSVASRLHSITSAGRAVSGFRRAWHAISG
jgi:hypothetical protein